VLLSPELTRCHIGEIPDVEASVWGKHLFERGRGERCHEQRIAVGLGLLELIHGLRSTAARKILNDNIHAEFFGQKYLKRACNGVGARPCLVDQEDLNGFIGIIACLGKYCSTDQTNTENDTQDADNDFSRKKFHAYASILVHGLICTLCSPFFFVWCCTKIPAHRM
jgi:hypothetical protein